MFAGMSTAGSTGATAGSGAAGGSSAAPTVAASGPWGWIAAAVAAKAIYDVESGTLDTYSDLWTNPVDSMQKITAADKDSLGQFAGEGVTEAAFTGPEITLALAEGDFSTAGAKFEDLVMSPFSIMDDLF
jgi:hypothetical protein